MMLKFQDGLMKNHRAQSAFEQQRGSINFLRVLRLEGRGCARSEQHWFQRGNIVHHHGANRCCQFAKSPRCEDGIDEMFYCFS